MENPVLKYLIIPFMAFLFVMPLGSFGQSGKGNPFDLVFRLDEEEQTAIAQPDINPFDVSPLAESLIMERKERSKIKSENPLAIYRYEEDKPVSRITFLYLILPLLLFVTFVVSIFRDRLTSLVPSARSANLMNIAYREAQGRFHPHSIFTYIICIIVFGLYGMLVFRESNLNQGNFIKATSIAVGLSALYICAKLFVLHALKHIFPNKDEFGQYIFMVGQLNHLLGLFLLPFVVFMAFADVGIAKYVTWVSFFFLGLWWILRALRGLQIGGKFLSVNIFRFFAYLCTVEIAPLILIIATIQLILGGS